MDLVGEVSGISAEGENGENPASMLALETSKINSQDTLISNAPAQMEIIESETQNL